MAVTRRAYAGAGVQTTIPSGITGTPASFDIALATGWPSSLPFYVVIDPDLSTEEKSLVTRSGVTCTVLARGVDGTSQVNHAAGAACYPCITAVDLDEANRIAVAMTTQGDLIIPDASGSRGVRQGRCSKQRLPRWGGARSIPLGSPTAR